MLDYLALAAVAAVVREGSFERAAHVLGVTPSAVSQRVKGLEERLGAVLVVRGQPCRATEIGERLCAHVERVRLLEGDVVSALPRLTREEVAERRTVRAAVNADSLATWFPAAAAGFAEDTGALLDLILDDEDYTADKLRSGEVLAAVTADPTLVAGCRIVPLGILTYTALASPGFVARFFPDGVDAEGLEAAPILRFDRRDRLQVRWAAEALGAELAPPTHWAPSTQGMLDLALVSLGWTMAPAMLAAEPLAAGRLVELLPGRRIGVKLYWQHSRIGASLIDRLTVAVRQAAREHLDPA